MKKLIIQLLCAEILRLRKIANEALANSGEAEKEKKCRIDMIGRQNEIIGELRHKLLMSELKNEQSLKTNATYSGIYDELELAKEKIVELENENQLITEERNDLLLHKLANTPKIVSQWKNSAKDGLPVLKVGDIIVFKEQPFDINYRMLDCVSDFDLNSAVEYLESNTIFEYIIIKIQCN